MCKKFIITIAILLAVAITGGIFGLPHQTVFDRR